MSPASIIAAISNVINLAGAAAALGKDIAPYAKAIYDNLISGKEVTQDDIDALEMEVNAMHDEIQKPLPPEEG